jgi:hypothetical protein
MKQSSSEWDARKGHHKIWLFASAKWLEYEAKLQFRIVWNLQTIILG